MVTPENDWINYQLPSGKHNNLAGMYLHFQSEIHIDSIKGSIFQPAMFSLPECSRKLHQIPGDHYRSPNTTLLLQKSGVRKHLGCIKNPRKSWGFQLRVPISTGELSWTRVSGCHQQYHSFSDANSSNLCQNHPQINRWLQGWKAQLMWPMCGYVHLDVPLVPEVPSDQRWKVR